MTESGGGFLIATDEHGSPGVLAHMAALAEEIAKRGHSSILLLGRNQERAADFPNPSGVNVLRCPAPWPGKRWNVPFLYQVMRHNRPRCLFAHFNSVNQVIFVGSFLQVPCRVAQIWSMSENIKWYSPWQSEGTWLGKFHLKMACRLATHVVSASRAVLEDLVEFYGVPESKCTVSPSVLADPITSQGGCCAPERKPFHVVCAGKFHPVKGQDVLIRALALLKREIPSIQAEFLGAGPQLDDCRRLAREMDVDRHCTFAGWVAHDAVLRGMASAQVTVVPSRAEAFGYVNVESMSVGAPVVASRVGGIPEIIRDGIDGFLVPPGDPVALAEKLKWLLLHPAEAQEIGRQARRRFLESFELSRVLPRQVEWLEQIAGLKAGPLQGTRQVDVEAPVHV